MPTLYRKHDKKPSPPSAEIFVRQGKRIARWKDSHNRTKSAPLSEDGSYIVLERPNWYFDYDGPEGRKTGVKGYRDKEATEALAQRLERDAVRIKQGLAPSVDPVRSRTAWGEALGKWLGDLQRQGCDEVYVANMRRLVSKVADGCNWTTLAGIRGDRVRDWLADIKLNGVPDRNGQRKSTPPSDRTVDQYLECSKRFLSWCCDQQPPYLDENPLEGIKKIPKPKKVRRRRALSEAELLRLLRVAGKREPVYKVAALTGLRKDELRQLQWRDVRLDQARPAIHLRPEANKSRRDDRIPLNPAVIDVLTKIRPVSPQPLDPVFPEIPTLDTLKRDLQRASIPYRDAEGRQADFHSLRYSFCTMLARAGVPIRTAMELMRHKDPKLTLQIYCDAGHLETDEAVGRLPALVAVD
jgi:integrase